MCGVFFEGIGGWVGGGNLLSLSRGCYWEPILQSDHTGRPRIRYTVTIVAFTGKCTKFEGENWILRAMTQQLIETIVDVIAVLPNIRNKFDLNRKFSRLMYQFLLKAAFKAHSVKWYRGADKSLARPGRKQPNVSVRMAWISFGALPCRKRKNLMTARVSMLLKSFASLTCFRACFLPGRAKDLSAPRYCIHPIRKDVNNSPHKEVCMCVYIYIYTHTHTHTHTRGGAVGWRTTLKAGRSRGRFPMVSSFQPHYGPGVDSASNRNEYQEYFLGGKVGRCLGLTTLPPSCADCLQNLGVSTSSWNPQGLSRPVMGLLYFFFTCFDLLTSHLQGE